jgi:hypothetical protein
MSMRYIGGVLSSTAPTVTTSSAKGMWTLSQQAQYKKDSVWPAYPATPTIGTATAVTYNSATVTFTAPANTYGITGYTATSSPSGITGTISGAGSGTITVSGLSATTSYTFTVAANSAAATGASSSASNSITTPAAFPTTIGQAWGGGFYAGKINVSGTQYYLIVAPKASGENSVKEWGNYGTTTGITSVINGPTNSASLAAGGAAYGAATFCEGLSIGGYSDWYLPAKNELEVLYYFLKPTTDANNTSSGSNANAVSPKPISTNYTSGSPAQTSAGIGFRTGETDAFASNYYWSSTEANADDAWRQYFFNGGQGYYFKTTASYVRAVRRIAV